MSYESSHDRSLCDTSDHCLAMSKPPDKIQDVIVVLAAFDGNGTLADRVYAVVGV